MLSRLRMLGAMGNLISAFGVGMGGAVRASRGGVKVYGERHYTPKEWARIKKRRKMARESRRLNRQRAA